MTAMPMKASCTITMLTSPSRRHVAKSVEYQVLNVAAPPGVDASKRRMRSQTGAAPATWNGLADSPVVAARSCVAIPFDGETIASAF